MKTQLNELRRLLAEIDSLAGSIEVSGLIRDARACAEIARSRTAKAIKIVAELDAQQSPAAPELAKGAPTDALALAQRNCRFLAEFHNTPLENFMEDLAPAFADLALPSPAPELAAVRTLEALGYSYHGADQWKPPLGKAPAYITGETPELPEEARILMVSAQGQIEHMAECTENLGEDLEDDDVSESVTEAREVAEKIGAFLAGRRRREVAMPELTDTKRLNFMLRHGRQVIVEVLPGNQKDVYVEEGILGEVNGPAVTVRGDICAEELQEVKRRAIDLAMAQGGHAYGS